VGQYKFYIWELPDYNPGGMFAMAESVEQARELIKAFDPAGADYYKDELAGDPSHCHDQPAAYLLWGNG
jgi:hypothetical protein